MHELSTAGTRCDAARRLPRGRADGGRVALLLPGRRLTVRPDAPRLRATTPFRPSGDPRSTAPTEKTGATS